MPQANPDFALSEPVSRQLAEYAITTAASRRWWVPPTGRPPRRLGANYVKHPRPPPAAQARFANRSLGNVRCLGRAPPYLFSVRVREDGTKPNRPGGSEPPKVGQSQAVARATPPLEMGFALADLAASTRAPLRRSEPGKPATRQAWARAREARAMSGMGAGSMTQLYRRGCGKRHSRPDRQSRPRWDPCLGLASGKRGTRRRQKR